MKRLWLIVSFLCLFFTFGKTAGTIQRVEPPFWWTGMKNPRVQLLVYGENIGSYNPAISYTGVVLETVTKVQSPNYLFLQILIVDNQKPADFAIQFDKKNHPSLTCSYSLLPREAGSAERKGYDASDVLYLITPDRFANGDPANDQVAGLVEAPNRSNPGGRHGGDILGISNNLDYLKDLGFTAIWLNPVLENNQPTYSYHGYSTTDFYKVDARFGTNEAYQTLCRQAKAKGIKSIMDVIVNHCGSGHWWMDDLPTRDWINFNNHFVPTTHKRTIIQDPYASNWDAKQFSDGWFVETMPDLNQRNPLMATYLIQNSIWWIEYAGLSGIRMDTYPYPDKDFMTDWTCQIMQEYPNFNIVGEEWTENPALVAHWQRGKLNKNGYTSCLPGLMDFPIQACLSRALTQQESSGRGWIQLYEMLANDFLYPDPYNLVVFPDNHDMSRFYTQAGENFDLFKQGLLYTLTTRGIPQLYYGTEILMTNPGTTDHGVIRSDYAGGWQGDTINAFTGSGLTDKQKEAQAFVKKVLNWRKAQPALHTGKMLHFVPFEGFYVYFRYNAQQTIMVVLNKNTAEKLLDCRRFEEALGDAKLGRELLSGKPVDFSKGLLVPGLAAMVINVE